MAQQKSHTSISAILAIVYGVLGIAMFRFHPEFSLLGSLLVFICGVLPNIDAGPNVDSTKDFIGLLAAIAPLALIESFPMLKEGGMARIALVVICGFIFTRWLLSKILTRFVARRGMLHSIPAAIITSELVYLLFWDIQPQGRLFLAAAAFFGFISHLLVDAYGNIDFVGGKQKKAPVMKVKAPSWESTMILYSSMAVLGWFVLRDLYPHMRVYGGLSY